MVLIDSSLTLANLFGSLFFGMTTSQISLPGLDRSPNRTLRGLDGQRAQAAATPTAVLVRMLCMPLPMLHHILLELVDDSIAFYAPA
jgi:hypothetical protein